MPLLIDAEQTWFQSAIDYLSLSFMPEYNSKKAIIYNTYQMYLKDALPRLKLDLGAFLLNALGRRTHARPAERAREGNYKFGAKLVRGAYMIAGTPPPPSLSMEVVFMDILHRAAACGGAGLSVAHSGAN